MKEIDTYKKLVLQKIKIEDVSIGLRQIGQGKHLVFIHGFPTHGYTWRKIIPALSKYFRCHILDLPGLGDSEWTRKTNFNTTSQASYIRKLLDNLGIHTYSLIAHNSGATIARQIALTKKEKVENLVLFNTEIPNHRPPWIPFYQKVGQLPFVPTLIRTCLQQQWFIKSSMGFREFYADKSMLDTASNIFPYVDPAVRSLYRTKGALKYLKGIDWKLVDDFEHLHKRIKARTLFIWGEKDKTFPINLGKQMIEQFKSETEFVSIENASLLPHEEKPNEVVSAILNFIKE